MNFFLLQKENPTDDETSQAKSMADNEVKNHYALLKNKMPKVHVGDDRADDQYLTFCRGFVLLLIEHWMKQNYHEGYKVEHELIMSLAIRPKLILLR